MRDLGSSRKPSSPTRAGSVKREARVGSVGPADMFIRQKAIGAAADDLRDRLERRSRRQPLRHDRGNIGPRPGEGLRQMAKGTPQTELDGAIVGCRQVVGCGHQCTSETDAWSKSTNAGDDVARKY